MARILAGRRRYFGHKRTIRPNAKKLYAQFLNRTHFTWDMFASKVNEFQKGFMGEPNEIRPGRGEFHENPFTCICEKKVGRSASGISTKLGSINHNDNVRSDGGELKDNYSDEEEIDWHELDYGENVPLGQALPNRTEPLEEPELEEMLSD